MIRVIRINSEQMPAPTNTTSSNEPPSQVLSSDLAFVGPLPPGLLTFYRKERKTKLQTSGQTVKCIDFR